MCPPNIEKEIVDNHFLTPLNMRNVDNECSARTSTLEVFVINKIRKKICVWKIRRSQVASIYGVGSIYQLKILNRNSEYES